MNLNTEKQNKLIGYSYLFNHFVKLIQFIDFLMQ